MTKPVTGLTTFGSNTTGTTTQLDNNFTACTTALNDWNTYKNYLADSGAANAYIVTLPASTTGALSDGLQIQVKIATTNTGASVLNYNATGNANIVTADGSAMLANQLVANAIVQLQYSNAMTAWQAQTAKMPAVINFTGTLTGCSTAPTQLITGTRNDKQITIDLPSGFTATSNATTKTITGMPTSLRPASGKVFTGIGVDNGGTAAAIRIDVGTDGVITLYKDVAAGSWTNSGTFTVQPFALTYNNN